MERFMEEPFPKNDMEYNNRRVKKAAVVVVLFFILALIKIRMHKPDNGVGSELPDDMNKENLNEQNIRNDAAALNTSEMLNGTNNTRDKMENFDRNSLMNSDGNSKIM